MKRDGSTFTFFHITPSKDRAVFETTHRWLAASKQEIQLGWFIQFTSATPDPLTWTQHNTYTHSTHDTYNTTHSHTDGAPLKGAIWEYIHGQQSAPITLRCRHDFQLKSAEPLFKENRFAVCLHLTHIHKRRDTRRALAGLAAVDDNLCVVSLQRRVGHRFW